MTTEYLYLNSRDELLRIDISKIVYFEGEGNYTYIFLTNSTKEVVPISLVKMQEMLSAKLQERASTFVRLGKRHIINRHFVYRINIPQQNLFLSDCDKFSFKIDVSKEALKKLRELYVTSANSNK